jgi:hypothetical protein
MVKLKKLAERAKKAKDLVDQQGSRSKGSIADKAKAAADVAREKPPSRPA